MFQITNESDKLNKRIIKPILKSFSLNKFELSDCINLDDQDYIDEMKKFLDNYDEDIKILDLMRNQRIDLQLRVTKRDVLPKKKKNMKQNSSISLNKNLFLDKFKKKTRLENTMTVSLGKNNEFTESIIEHLEESLSEISEDKNSFVSEQSIYYESIKESNLYDRFKDYPNKSRYETVIKD